MQNNPEIEQIIDNAGKLAKKYKHQYVTIEHLALALVRYESFNKILTASHQKFLFHKIFNCYLRMLHWNVFSNKKCT